MVMCCCSVQVQAIAFLPGDSTAVRSAALRSVPQKDVYDLITGILGIEKKVSDTVPDDKKVQLTVAPAVSYALYSGWAGLVGASASFKFNKDSGANWSFVRMRPMTTEKKQLVLPFYNHLWVAHDRYAIQGYLKYYNYRQVTYGLGGYSTDIEAFDMNYQLLSMQESILRAVAPKLYLGLGYSLSYHWDIVDKGNSLGSPSDFQKYGDGAKSSSSGLLYSFLYDNRSNAVHPQAGAFCSMVYKQNYRFLGSDHPWQSLLLDARKYFRILGDPNKILAFWSYNWLTLSGRPPFLDLPSTAWDTYENLGRGYTQSRFRSRNLIYLESEYRFNVLRNGLLGAVVFVNAQSVTDAKNNVFSAVWPGTGVGIRIKFNKTSNTNVAIDYGFGMNGSRGFFVNLGEVF